MCLYWKGSDGNVMNVCGGIHARTLDLHGAFCLKVWWLSLTPILFISPLLLPSSVYTNVEIESLLTLLSPYSSIEQYFSYFPHNQLSLPLFSFHLHPITLPPRFPPASPSAILLSLFFSWCHFERRAMRRNYLGNSRRPNQCCRLSPLCVEQPYPNKAGRSD